MKKKILSILCFITLACLSVFGLTACGEEDKTIFTAENGVITGLTEYGKTLTEIVIPESIDGVTITTIGDFAFNQMTSVTSISIPNTVTKINRYAFCGCSSLTSIEIPSGVTSIGDFAFTRCDSLNSIVLPKSVVSIGNSAFSSIREITLSNTDTLCGIQPFTDKLNKVNFIGTIDEWAQSSWGKVLSEIQLPYEGYDLYINGEIVTNLTLTETTEISAYAFYFCRSLNSATLTNKVKRLGYASFQRCKFLTSVGLGEGVTSIGEDAFLQCIALESINFPSSITSIDAGAFTQCKSLTSITLPNTIKIIRSSTFDGCENLKTVTMYNSVKEIGETAFAMCNALDTIVFIGTKEDWNSISKGTWWHLNTKPTNVYCDDGLIFVYKEN